VSEREQHRERWSDDIAAYALGALDEREAALLEHHLAECEPCTAELRWLQPAVDAIPASVEPLTPPPALRERLLSVVREEAEPAADARPEKAGRRFRLPFFGSVALRPALAGAAVLLLAAGVAGYELRNTTEDTGGPATATYAATVPGTPVRGTLEVEGDKGYLHIENMPANRPNQVYQAWVQEPTASGGKPEVQPSSVFVVNQGGTGEVMIPHGLDNAAKVMITREPKGGSELPSEPAMMTVKLG
jgi:anti-sigma-K factor RskA